MSLCCGSNFRFQKKSILSSFYHEVIASKHILSISYDSSVRPYEIKIFKVSPNFVHNLQEISIPKHKNHYFYHHTSSLTIPHPTQDNFTFKTPGRYLISIEDLSFVAAADDDKRNERIYKFYTTSSYNRHVTVTVDVVT